MSHLVNSRQVTCAEDIILADLIEEATARLQAGESVNLDDIAGHLPAQREQLRQLLPALQALAGAADTPPRPTPPPATRSARPADPVPGAGPLRGILGDYRILREIGRGGMGIVYEAEQLSLGRRVALKVLPFAGALHPKQLQRFRNEAQAAAQLHHTNIVPVFAVGCEQGVHYYAMQYIDGHSLAAVVHEMRQHAGLEPAGRTGDESDVPATNRPATNPPRTVPPRTVPPADAGGRASARADAGEPIVSDRVPPHDPASDRPTTPSPLGPKLSRSTGRPASPARPRASTTASPVQGMVSTYRTPTDSNYQRAVARLGIQAAEALEYAHQCGIIHRDIKPANLLVDARGNLWVADFGLVRTAGDRPEGRLTCTGELLGTLQYMSPEQALGEHGLVDHRTDVYALGVTLYELLTLEPVVTGRTRQDILARLAADQVRPPRSLNRSIPVELETIVLKAVAHNAPDRYATAQALADDLQRFLDHQPIRARRPTLFETAARLARRYRRTVWTTVAIGLCFLPVLVVDRMIITGQNQELAREKHESEAQRRETRQVVDEMYTQVAERWLATQPHLEPLKREYLHKALACYEKLARHGGADPSVKLEAARAARRVGDINQALGESARADEAYAQAQAALDDPDVTAALPLDAAEERGVLHNHRGNLARAAGRVTDAQQQYRLGLTCFARLVGAGHDQPSYRDGLAGSSANLGMVLHAAGTLGEAEKAFQQAVILLKRLNATDPTPAYRHDFAGALNSLGLLFRDQGRPRDAEAAFSQANALWKPLADEFPAVPLYRQAEAAGLHNYAQLLLSTGRPQEAERAERAALAVREKLAADFSAVISYHQDLASSYHGLSLVLVSDGRHAEAERHLRRGLAVRERLAARFPGERAYRREVAASRHGLGSLLELSGRPDEAVGPYRAAMLLRRALAAESGATAAERLELGATLRALARVVGRTATKEGDAAETDALYREALAVLADASMIPARAEHAATWGDVARHWRARGRNDEALPAAKRAVVLAQQLADDHPGLVAATWLLAGSLQELAVLQAAVNGPATAEPTAKRCLTLRAGLAAEHPAMPTYHGELARLLLFPPVAGLRDPEKAAESAAKAVELAPLDGHHWHTLGVASFQAGRWRGARAALEKSVEIRGGDPTDLLLLALSCHHGHDPAAARDWYKRALRRLKTHPPGPDAADEVRRLREDAARLLDQGPPLPAGRAPAA